MRQPLRVVGLEDKAADRGAHQSVAGADGIRAEDRDTERQSLVDDEAPRLVGAGQDQGESAVELARDLVRLEEAEEADALDAAAANFRSELLALLARTAEPQFARRGGLEAAIDLIGVERAVEVLLRDVAGDHREMPLLEAGFVAGRGSRA